MFSASQSLSRNNTTTVQFVIRLVVLVLPAAILLLGSFLRPEHAQTDRELVGGGQGWKIFMFGAIFQVLLFSWIMLSQQALFRPLGFPVTLTYLSALAWLWIADLAHSGETGIKEDWFSHFAQAVFLIVPLFLFSLRILGETGVFASRRARMLAHTMARRNDWPDDLRECLDLPEIRALRDALGEDAGPALGLLRNSSPQVRLIALSALDSWHYWQHGQIELVMHVSKEAREPIIRSAAIAALADIDDRNVIELLAEFCRDPDRQVRQAAFHAIRWDTEKRWFWVRNAIRNALSDPVQQDDGPLRFDGPPLRPDIVTDLQAWATEKGSVGARAAQTLGMHYARALGDHVNPALIDDLKKQLADPHTSPALRMELGQLLHSNGELDRHMLERLIDQSNPAPLRLLAAEALLAEGPQLQAVTALREIARLPNRELALHAAGVVQRRLGIDLGLALGQPLPALHSRQAADVTRRLMKWAADQSAGPIGAPTMMEMDMGTPEPHDPGADTPQPGSGVRRTPGRPAKNV